VNFAEENSERTRTLLGVEGLTMTVSSDEGTVRVVDGISFDVGKGEIVGLAGESGSGKSVTARAVMGLLPVPPWKIESGAVYFEGTDLTTLDPDGMRRIRGRKISIVFQEPMTSLNPYYTVGDQIEEVFVFHLGVDRARAREMAVEALEEVGMPNPSVRAGQYPHQLSGGLRQRAMIAMSLALRPLLLFADEPTTALDLTIQAQILDLFLELNREKGMSMVFITHDLALLRGLAHRMVIIYAGVLVECGDTRAVYDNPRHPYTRALLDVIPRPGGGKGRLETIPGSVPRPGDRPPGCPFHPRCGKLLERCRRAFPPLFVLEGGGKARCWLYESEALSSEA